MDARSRSWENVSLVHVMCLDKSWIFVDRPGLVQKCRMTLRVPVPVPCEILSQSHSSQRNATRVKRASCSGSSHVFTGTRARASC